MKLLISGKRGRIGTALTRRFSNIEGIETGACDRTELPLDDLDAVKQCLDEREFDVLVNAAAMTSVDRCEEDEAAAWASNAHGPREMARICAERGARFIHLSTDYVFDGKEPGERKENDPTAPFGNYGNSKREGEVAVLEASDRNLVVRTSWVFGPDRPSFPDMILKRAMEQTSVSAISDKWSCPCYSEDFAEWMQVVLARPDITGILHLCNTGSCSWQEYGQAVLDIASSLGVSLKTHKVEPMALSEMAHFTIPRPVHTALSTRRFADLSGTAPRPWKEALEEFFRKRLG